MAFQRNPTEGVNKMKKTYEAPELTLAKIEKADVITTSMALPIVPFDVPGFDW